MDARQNELSALCAKPLEQLSADDYKALGFSESAGVARGLAELARSHGVEAALAGRTASLLRALAQSCDPDQAFLGLQRWAEAGGPAAAPGWTEAPFLELLCQLFAATPGLSQYVIRFPQRTSPVLEPILHCDPHQPPIQRPRREDLTGEGWPAQLSALRRVRVETMLRIAALDLQGKLSLHGTVRALSDLADGCIALALEMAVERVRARLGDVPGPLPLAVFALGKLGGRELNYSSDIDLVFAYGGSGETSSAARPVDYQTYFTAVCEALVAALDSVTEDGRVYRVDLRLRPHGGAGPLVQNVRAMKEYFEAEGRTWERQAWLKARAVAGDVELGRRFLSELAPFIFRRYFTLDAINDLKALKRQMELSVERRGESEDEVKLGRGGIRDIEFVVQFMQLLHGGENPRVRSGNTLQALYDLRREGLLRHHEAEPLNDAYVFLRHVEHRLQLRHDLQVHLLPADAASRRRMARSLGYEDLAGGERAAAAPAQDQFERDRARHTANTRGIFERLFAHLFREQTGTEGELSELLLAPEPEPGRLAGLLGPFGFAEPESSARELLELGRADMVLTPSSRTRKFYASVAPSLLKALAATGEPDEALRRFSRIATSLGGKAVLFQMLNENPWLLKMTVDLAAWSEYLTSILVANPGLFDELVDALETARSKTLKTMMEELGQIALSGDIADTLRAYRAGEVLRIGVRDLIHSAGEEQTESELTDLAEALLRTQVQHCLNEQRQRYGSVLAPGAAGEGGAVGFAVLGVGKCGSREMNYGSDLDVIFFYGADGQTAGGMDAVTYFTELAQHLMRSMATPTALGPLYGVDARLRPNGNKGPLALSLDYFRRYWKEGQLADWERLALTRARLVAGDEGVGERALHLIRSAIYSPLKDTQALAHEVAAMRKRLEESADKGDLKRGRGGTVDVEFVAQYLQLVHGATLPPLRQANTEQALKALMRFRKLDEGDGTALLNAYSFLRRMENRVRIVHGLSAHRLPQKAEALRKLALRAGYTDAEGRRAEEALSTDYETCTRQTRRIFTRLVGS
jgi:glutamate-ammonia-ligase adenylyltransferase